MKKIVIISLIIVVAIVLGVMVAIDFNGGDRTKPTASNKVQEDKTNNTVQNNANTNTEENITGTDDDKEKEKEEENKEPKTDLEKAIEIVKKDWGEDNSVYFSQEGKNNDKEYIICVRNKNTTEARAWYTVNVEERTFTQEK